MATLSATNPLLTRSVSDVLYDYSLSSAYRGAFVYEPSFALARTPDVWEIVRNDVSFSASFDRYCNNVTKPWHVEAPKKSKDDDDKEYAGIVEDALGQIYDFDSSRWVLAEAAFLGRKYAYIESERRTLSLGGGQEMEWIVPTFIKDIDRRRFRWVPVTEGAGNTQKRYTKLSFYNTLAGQWQDVQPSTRQALIEYIWYNTEDRVGYGRGWLEPIYFAHYMKTNTIQKVADGIDRWAKGIWVVKLDGLRNGSTDKTNEALLAGAKTMIQVMRSDNIAVMENVDDIDVKESTGTGHEMGMSFIDYWDNGVERLVNGSTRPAGLGGQKTGARAQSETEEDTSEAHYQPARDRIDAVINRDLIGWFISQPLNRQNFQKLGLDKAKRPIYHTRQEKKMTIPDVVASATLFLGQGLPLIEGEVYERCGGWGVPAKEDKTVTGKMPMGQGEMIGDFGKADEINQNAQKGAEADRQIAKQKAKPAKMEEDEIQAKFHALREQQNTKALERMEESLTTFKEQVILALSQKQPSQPITVNASIEAPDSQVKKLLECENVLIESFQNTNIGMKGLADEVQKMRTSIPTPIVHVVNEVKPDAPIINNVFQEQPAHVVNVHPDTQTAQSVNGLTAFLKEVFAWFMGRKPIEKKIEVTRNSDGKIQGANITEKP